MKDDDIAECYLRILMALHTIGRNADTVRKALKLDGLISRLQSDKPRQEQLEKAMRNIYVDTLKALDALRPFDEATHRWRKQTAGIPWDDEP